MKISILTLFPDLYQNFFSTSLIKKAHQKGLFEYNLINLLDIPPITVRVDQPTSGPGPGMLVKTEVIEAAIDHAQERFGKGIRILFSPQGNVLNQPLLEYLKQQVLAESSSNPEFSEKTKSQKNTSKFKHLILICPRYEGIDARVEQELIDLQISIGDYVLLGGDLPCQVFLEGLLRLLPGFIGNQASFQEESFQDSLLDHDQYAYPLEWRNLTIPEVILSGNHQKIADWRQENALQKTVHRRFDWLRQSELSAELQQKTLKTIPKHYLAIMYNQVLIRPNEEGVTSIKSLDIHDIARSAATYGIEKLFVVQQLEDQKSILRDFVNFWTQGKGELYNPHRHQAVGRVQMVDQLKEAIEQIRQETNQAPLIIATSAKRCARKMVSFNDQEHIFSQNRPVLILFGTGHGLIEELIEACDYLFCPIDGLSGYNHLSVRAAASIVMDRWLGLQPRRQVLVAKKFDKN